MEGHMAESVSVDTMSVSHTGHVVQHVSNAGQETDWWLWLMYGFFIFAVIILFFIIIFEDPEVRSYSRQ